MIADGEAVGMIALQDHARECVYTEHDVEVLSIIAGQAAAAFRNAQLFAAARRAYKELSDAQTRLLESVQLPAVTETVGALNHEVNNPLASIAGNAQLLLRQPGELSPRRSRRCDVSSRPRSAVQTLTAKMSNLIRRRRCPTPATRTSST
jgi:nitrogen-specific signal transduction histidine kinase